MEWACLEDRQNRGDWRVEAIDFENEGEVYVAIFSGPSARERAEEYAALESGQESRLARTPPSDSRTLETSIEKSI